MGDRELVERTDEPVTTDRIVDDLRSLGVDTGDTLLVHASLSAIGWVAGGPQAVVDALQRAVGETGTVVVPTHTPQYIDPEQWSNPPVPEAWFESVRASMPPYRPAVTPSHGVGAIPECLRTYPEAVRSRHPLFSFAALGADAAAIAGDHRLDFGLGEGSPLGRIYDRGGRVLMLGTGYETNTSIHLAEYRASVSTERAEHRAPVRRDGERVVVAFEDIETSTDDFERLGAAFERSAEVKRESVGEANATLVAQQALVDFAVEWLEENRP
ncbi:aminoglycoside N(3)-acetyltransferase [Halapricum desulfuricans]|uniref:Aminoglycoside N3'-acetyltransferase n=1 Tax=Halapricum desulfuricans TaxID=2841257 RepID=A0A897MZA7_9EURY|nr:AAC(3) family N-acetyltransferase [Halapricum desulfuricans]QSG05784.1 Aminoglycoside N3'-acetyltransferase [Halapricum desulfuricans]